MPRDKSVEMAPQDRLARATEALADANLSYHEAQSAANTANSMLTAATNRVNEKQREFDAAVEAVRKDGTPKRSDWAQRN